LDNSDLAAKIYAACCALAKAITRNELRRDCRAVLISEAITYIGISTAPQHRFGLRIDKATAAVVGERCALRRCHCLAGDPIEAGGVVIPDSISRCRGDDRVVRARRHNSRVGSGDVLARLTDPSVASGIGDAAHARCIARLTEGRSGLKNSKGKTEDRERLPSASRTRMSTCHGVPVARSHA